MADADGVIAEIRKTNWNANHNCVAIIVGENADQQRSSDDGEPSGTAGVPMLEVLRAREMTDIVAVVTRYFGGVLLGAGGLIRAYSSAVAAALDAAVAAGVMVQRRALTEVTFPVRYTDVGRIENYIRDWVTNNDAVLEPIEYATAAQFTVLVPPSSLEKFITDLAAVSAGALDPVTGKSRIVDIRQK